MCTDGVRLFERCVHMPELSLFSLDDLIFFPESPELPVHFNIGSSDSESISVAFSLPEEKPSIPQSCFLQYRKSEDAPGLWHQVSFGILLAHCYLRNNCSLSVNYR